MTQRTDGDHAQDHIAHGEPPPFVGRRAQVQWLEHTLRATVEGQPQLVLLPGDAGVGKTRLLKEFRLRAERKGVRVYYGRCHEEIALPLLPFAEALRADLVSDAHHPIGTEVGLLKQLFDRHVGPAADPARAITEADEEKLRLFLSVSRAMIQLAHSGPIALMLDDLHWADRASLDLFAHLAFAVSDQAGREAVPFMLLASYRPTEPETPVARVVARLEREDICHTLYLAGLSEAEVDTLIDALGLHHPAHQLVVTVSRATRGNPLFVQEVVRHLVVHGSLRVQGDHLVTSAPVEASSLPQQLSSAIDAHIRGLSREANEILAIASLLGDRFDVGVLTALSSVTEAALLDRLEEAMHERLLVSEDQSFQFAHPLIRQAFEAKLSADRRQHLHRHIAEELERLYAAHIDDHVIEIAHHWVAAASAAPPRKTLEFSKRAGDRAAAAFAWDEASNYYEAALAAATSVEELSQAERISLHLRAAHAHFRDWDQGPSLDQYERAVALCSQSGDDRGLVIALQQQTAVRIALGAVPYGAVLDVQPLRAALERLGTADPNLRGRACATLADAYWAGRQSGAAETLAREALAIATQIGDDRLQVEACVRIALAQIQSLQLTEAITTLRAGLDGADRTGDLWMKGWPLQRLPVPLTCMGRLDEASLVARQACAVAESAHDWGGYSLALATRVTVAVARGDFESAEEDAYECQTMVHRSGYAWGGLLALSALACGRALRGDWAGASETIDMLQQPGVLFDQVGGPVQLIAWVYHQLIRAYAGTLAERERSDLASSSLGAFGDEASDIAFLAPLCALVEIGDVINAPALAEGAYALLSHAADRGVVFTSGWVFLLPRVLGVAAGMRKQWGVAAERFTTAQAVATAANAQPELGRTFLDHARMLVARGERADRPRAIALVQRASEIFCALGMGSFWNRAAPLAATLSAPIPVFPRLETGALHATALKPGPQSRVIMFTDMESSTRIFERLGDERAGALLQQHDTIIRACLRQHDGAEVHHTGDGFLCAFLSAASAIRCALAIQSAFAAQNAAAVGTPVRVRVGLNAGEPLVRDGNLFGGAVNAAARICARARPGEILASEVVRQLAAGERFQFADRGRAKLKGFAERFRLYEVELGVG